MRSAASASPTRSISASPRGAALGLGDALQRGLQLHVLAARQQRVQRGLLQRGADRGAHGGALADDVVARHARRARGGRQQRGEHQDGGGLAGAVGAEEAVDLAGLDAQVDAVDGARAVLELADEALHLDAVVVSSWPTRLAQYLVVSNIFSCNNGGVPPSHLGRRRRGRLFWRIFSADKPRRMAVFSELGLSFQQAMALGHLTPDEPLPMSALAGALQCDNSNVTGIVDRLEAAGLAERRPAERDRRVKTVVLTPHGEAVRARCGGARARRRPRSPRLSEEDATVLRDCCSARSTVAGAAARRLRAPAAPGRRTSPTAGSAAPRASARGCAPPSRPCARR